MPKGGRRGKSGRGITAPALRSGGDAMPVKTPTVTVQSGAYTPADREYWPGGGVVPVGLSDPSANFTTVNGITYDGFVGTVTNTRFTNAVYIRNNSRITFDNCWWDGEFEHVFINQPVATGDTNCLAIFYDCFFDSPQWIGSAVDYSTNSSIAYGGTYFYRCEWRGIGRAWGPWTTTSATPPPGLPPGGLMDGCWIHNMGNCGANPPWNPPDESHLFAGGHRTGVHWEYGEQGIIRNCWIEYPFQGTACLEVGVHGPKVVRDIIIENNVLMTECNIILQGGDKPDEQASTVGCKFRNNRIGTHYPFEQQPENTRIAPIDPRLTPYTFPLGSVTGYSSYGGAERNVIEMADNWEISGNVWHNSDDQGRVAGQPI